MLTLKDKIELLESRISRANFHWSLLFSVNLVVVGWALTNRSDFREVHLTLFVFVLFLAYVFIFTALLRAQSEMILLE